MLVGTLASISLVGVVVALVALVALHVLPTGLSPVRDAVSAYGISEFRALYQTQTIATGAAAAMLAVALPGATSAGTVGAIVCLWVLAVARAVIGWFPMDRPGAPRTGTGRFHNVLAFVAFAAASTGGFLLGAAFSADPRLAGFAAASTILGWIMSIASALTLLAATVRPMRPVFGLAERLIYVGMLAWLALGGVVLLVTGTAT